MLREIDLEAPWKTKERPRHRVWQMQRPASSGVISNWKPMTLNPHKATHGLALSSDEERGGLSATWQDDSQPLEDLLQTERNFDLAKERGRIARQRQMERLEAEKRAHIARRELRSYATTFGQAASMHAITQMREEARQQNETPRASDQSPTQPDGQAASARRRSVTPPARSAARAEFCSSSTSIGKSGSNSSPTRRATSPSFPLRAPSHPSASHERLSRVEAQTVASRARLQTMASTQASLEAQRTPRGRSTPRGPLESCGSACGSASEVRGRYSRELDQLRYGLVQPHGRGKSTVASRLHSLNAVRAVAARMIQRQVRSFLRLRAHQRRREAAAVALQQATQTYLVRRTRLRRPSSPRGRWAERVSGKGKVISLPRHGLGPVVPAASGGPTHERLHRLHSQRVMRSDSLQADQALEECTFTPQTNSGGKYEHVPPRTDTGLLRTKSPSQSRATSSHRPTSVDVKHLAAVTGAQTTRSTIHL